MAKKESKKVVDVCKKCGSEPCTCVKEEVKVELPKDFKFEIDSHGRKWLLTDDLKRVKRIE